MTSPHCPCDTGLPFDHCCGPLHDGTRTAGTAEQLMRSRYSAFVLGNPAYLLATWYPRTRPPELDGEGTVEFRAHYVLAERAGAQHENSRALRQGGQWRYLDGVSLP